MIHVTTKAEYSESIWVKNEWSRYLELIKDGQDKTLITCYQNMSVYDLPIEIRNIQGQDMSKIGAMQDLMYGVSKIMKVKSQPIQESIPLKEDDSIYDMYIEYKDKVTDFLNIDDYNCYPRMLEEYIDYFGSHINYKDSYKYLRQAKVKYIESVSTYKECLIAKEYLNDVAGLIDVNEANEKLNKKQYDFRVKELKKEKAIPKIDSIYKVSGLYYAVDEIVKANNNKRKYENSYDRDIIEKMMELAFESINQGVNDIIKSEKNINELRNGQKYLNYLVSNNIIAQEAQKYINLFERRIGEIEQEHREEDKKRRKRIALIITGSILSIVVVVLLISMAIKIKEQSYDIDNFSVNVTSKENLEIKEYNSKYYDDKYYYNFKFAIKNNSEYGITILQGNMIIKNRDGLELFNSNLALEGLLNSNDSATWDVKLECKKNDKAIELWNTSLDDLQIEFETMGIYYSNGKTKRYENGKTIIVSQYGQ